MESTPLPWAECLTSPTWIVWDNQRYKTSRRNEMVEISSEGGRRSFEGGEKISEGGGNSSEGGEEICERSFGF